jgi:stalled ribosome rescue protein Dom34
MTSTASHHVAVWLDHREARVFHVESDTVDEATFRSPRHHLRQSPDRNVAEKHHPDDATRFFHEIAQALDSAAEVLVCGPSTAKLHFLKYVHGHDPKLEKRIIGIETVDHPTDPQLVAFARNYFHTHGADRLPQARA